MWPRWTVAAIALAIAAGSMSPAVAGPIRALGNWEREAVAIGLRRKAVTVDPTPKGKRIRRIRVVNIEVFGADAGGARVLNAIHATTEPGIIRRELILTRGDVWDYERVLEAERNLRDPLLSTLVVIVPTWTPVPDMVDLLVVTRDVWSLRTNSELEFQDGEVSDLNLELAENNLFGWRKHLAAVLTMDLGAFTLGPRYRDPNLRGTRLRLLVRPRVLFSRASGDYEGTAALARLEYPLWSLARRWAASAELSYKNSVVRRFQGGGLAEYDVPETPEVEQIPVEFRQFDAVVRADATRSFGDLVKHNVTMGPEILLTRPKLRTSFDGDQVAADAFVRDQLPRSERASLLVARYRVFTPRFVQYRNVDGYDLPEDTRIGPDATVEIGLASRMFGSQRAFIRYRLSLGWVVPIGDDAYADMRVGASGRITAEADEIEDRSFDLRVVGVAPLAYDAFRVVGHLSVLRQSNVINNELFVVGGETGLRGYEVGAFMGTSFVLANLEVRSTPTKFWFMRVGGMVFWDAGHAADGFDNLSLRHDVGLGVRVFAPQTGESIYRFDWAVPLSGSTGGLPGRFVFGLEQVF